MDDNVAGRMEVMQGDITKLEVDAIVNAANPSLLGGGGVDGAIHRAAGPRLLEECKILGGCPTGNAKLSNGYDLPAKFVIHTVGPVWHDGDDDEDPLLERCYSRSLALAVENGAKTIAFPAISTGVYGFPKERAANIAVETVGAFLKDDKTLDKVIFCCFDQGTYEIYRRILAE